MVIIQGELLFFDKNVDKKFYNPYEVSIGIQNYDRG